jgi:hypothetical protein
VVSAPTGADRLQDHWAVPLGATAAWTEAAWAAGGQCTCTGQCARGHKSQPGHRCDHTLTGDYPLYLDDAGHLLCATCFDSTQRLRDKAERDKEALAAAEAPGLFDLPTGLTEDSARAVGGSR